MRAYGNYIRSSQWGHGLLICEEKPVWWLSFAVLGLEAEVGFLCQLGLHDALSKKKPEESKVYFIEYKWRSYQAEGVLFSEGNVLRMRHWNKANGTWSIDKKGDCHIRWKRSLGLIVQGAWTMLSSDGTNTEKSGAGIVAQCLRACPAGTRQANVIQSFMQW